MRSFKSEAAGRHARAARPIRDRAGAALKAGEASGRGRGTHRAGIIRPRPVRHQPASGLPPACLGWFTWFTMGGRGSGSEGPGVVGRETTFTPRRKGARPNVGPGPRKLDTLSGGAYVLVSPTRPGAAASPRLGVRPPCAPHPVPPCPGGVRAEERRMNRREPKVMAESIPPLVRLAAEGRAASSSSPATRSSTRPTSRRSARGWAR